MMITNREAVMVATQRRGNSVAPRRSAAAAAASRPLVAPTRLAAAARKAQRSTATAAAAAAAATAPAVSLGTSARRAELPQGPPGADKLRAVVIGSGVAGLVAARVLSERFDEVIILERDAMPGDDAAGDDAGSSESNGNASESSSSAAAPTPPATLADAVTARRRGVPQWAQPHVMLTRGLAELEALFPGLRAELVAAGAVGVPTPRGWAIFDARFGDELLPHANVLFDMLTASRALVETALRVRVARDCAGRVRTVSGAVVTGLLFGDGDGGSGGSGAKRVTGVELLAGGGSGGSGAADGSDPSDPQQQQQQQQQQHERARHRLHADLVVDASGRGSQTPDWLAAAGFAPPPTVTVDSNLVYTSAVYELAPNHPGPGAVIMFAAPPDSRSAIVMPIEGGRHHMILAGRGAEASAPSDDAIAAFVAALPHPAVADVLRGATRVGPARTYRRTANFRRLYEDLPSDGLPGGLAVIGDGVCAFNPVYGQGMSVAVLQALELGKQLSTALPPLAPGASGAAASQPQAQQQAQQPRDLAAARAALPAATRSFMRAVGSVVAVPWALAIGSDAPYVAGFKRTRAEAAVDAVFSEVARLSQADEGVHSTFLRVMHMLEPPTALASPRMLLKVAASKVKGALGGLKRALVRGGGGGGGGSGAGGSTAGSPTAR